jgi:hypothetical protein
MRSTDVISEAKRLCLRMRSSFLVAIGVGALVIATGCNQAYTNALSRSLGETMLTQAAVSSVRNKIEGPRGTTVNVNNNPSQTTTSQGIRTSLPANVVYSDEKYTPAPGYAWVNPNQQNDLRVIPKNLIILDNGEYTPAPGYAWVNPNQQNDLRVKKKDHEGYFKINTSSKWYIDENIILGNMISDETKSIYSSIIQDTSLSIKSGDNAREHYVEAAKKIDFQQSPAEFKEAYMRHINAWERNSKEEINSTWNEIERMALKYGVRKK